MSSAIIPTVMAARSEVNGAAVRADFPILGDATINERGQPLAFLDSAGSSQKPAAVIDAVSNYYERSNANIHRGVYQLSEIATSKYEEARHQVASFINAASPRECIFVRNTTEAINLVANSWGRQNLAAGDLILVTTLEHHSNLVPWHLVASATGARIEAIPLTDDLRLDMTAFDRLLLENPKVVAVGHVSNGVGTINDVATICAKAHEVGAVVVVDGAQSAPHLPIDVQALDCDFFAFSGHKMLAPMGAGVLYGKKALLESMPPFMGGGGMIKKVTITGSTYQDIPARFEAGTPAVGDAIGLGAAIDYLNRIGMDSVRQHELDLLVYAMDRLDEIPGLVQFGTRDLDQRSGVISFTLGDIHAHDVAAILDSHNVAVRAGHHCNQPLMDHLGVAATSRASLYVYNTRTDIDQLCDALRDANKIFGLA